MATQSIPCCLWLASAHYTCSSKPIMGPLWAVPRNYTWSKHKTKYTYPVLHIIKCLLAGKQKKTKHTWCPPDALRGLTLSQHQWGWPATRPLLRAASPGACLELPPVLRTPPAVCGDLSSGHSSLSVIYNSTERLSVTDNSTIWQTLTVECFC